MFDTHCHLNFKAFENNIEDIVKKAEINEIHYIIVPGTDLETSKKAIEISHKFKSVYAAVGIHPHHAYAMCNIKNKIQEIEELLKEKKVVAIGEVGIDKHAYGKTKYNDYKIDISFLNNQIALLVEQIKLALKYNKSLIFHIREAKIEFLKILNDLWDEKMRFKTVFHCCEPDDEILKFALEKNIYIGVDGDVTYSKNKQEFIRRVPLESLVMETDSPYLTPEPVRQTKKFPNEPANIAVIANFIAGLKSIPIENLVETTTKNAKTLFSI